MIFKRRTNRVYDIAGLWMVKITNLILIRGNVPAACWVDGCGKIGCVRPKNVITRTEIETLTVNPCNSVKLNPKSSLASLFHQSAYRPVFPQSLSSQYHYFFATPSQCQI